MNELNIHTLSDKELAEYLDFIVKLRKQPSVIDGQEVYIVHDKPDIDKRHKAYPFVEKYQHLFVDAILFEAGKRFMLQQKIKG